MRRLAPLVLLALLVAGCTSDGEGDGPVAGTTALPTGGTPPGGPPLRFSGDVSDVLTGEPVPGATVRLDLAMSRPCEQQGVIWRDWGLMVDDEGAFGPLEVPRPQSDDLAFFLHVEAPGYTENVTFVGPTGKVDLRFDVALHPEAAIAGRAPPGTLLALETDRFPRFTVADADGDFLFENARVVPAQLVAALDAPARVVVTAPADGVGFALSNASGWRLEGTTRSPTGAPVAADVVAWNGDVLWSAARSSDAGVFALQLPPEPAQLRLEARTASGSHGGARVVDVAGPPALRETVTLQPRC